jgi:hypothetical protein
MSLGVFVTLTSTLSDAPLEITTTMVAALTHALGVPSSVAPTVLAVMLTGVSKVVNLFGTVEILAMTPDGHTMVDGQPFTALDTTSSAHTPSATTSTLLLSISEILTTVSRFLSCSDPSIHGITSDSSFELMVLTHSKRDLASTEDQDLAFAETDTGTTKLIKFQSVSTTLLKP